MQFAGYWQLSLQTPDLTSLISKKLSWSVLKCYKILDYKNFEMKLKGTVHQIFIYYIRRKISSASFHFELKLKLFVMTKAVSNRNTCFIKTSHGPNSPPPPPPPAILIGLNACISSSLCPQFQNASNRKTNINSSSLVIKTNQGK